jgi:hypothetical protein
MLSNIPSRNMIQALTEQLEDEIIALYVRPGAEPAFDEYLLIVEESAILSVGAWSHLFQSCMAVAHFQLLSQREFLFQFSRSRLELIGWCLQGQWRYGRPVLQAYHVNLGQVGEQLEQALLQEQIRFRQAWFSATPADYRSLLQQTWFRFESLILPGLVCLSGLDLHAPELDLRLAEAFGLEDEQTLSRMRYRRYGSELELPACAAAWETVLWQVLVATERFTDWLEHEERSLSPVDVLGMSAAGTP